MSIDLTYPDEFDDLAEAIEDLAVIALAPYARALHAVGRADEVRRLALLSQRFEQTWEAYVNRGLEVDEGHVWRVKRRGEHGRYWRRARQDELDRDEVTRRARSAVAALAEELDNAEDDLDGVLKDRMKQAGMLSHLQAALIYAEADDGQGDDPAR